MSADPQLLALAIDSVADPVVVTDPSGAIRFVNAAFTRENGYLSAEVVGKTPRALKSGQTPMETYEQLWKTVTAGRTWAGEVVNRRKDGSCYLAELTVVPMMGADQKPRCLVATHRNITERRRAETGLRASEESFRAVIEHSPDAIVVHRAGSVLYANREAERLFGAAHPGALRGLALKKFLPASALGGHGEARLAGPAGQERTLEVTSVPLTFEGGPATLQVMRDVSEERRLTERMMLVDRMVAIGTLAAGVGHEINNPLVYIINNLDYTRTTLPGIVGSLASPQEASRARAQLGEIDAALSDALEGAQRVRSIVRDLSQFARSAEQDAARVDLEQVVDRALELVSTSIAERARLMRELEAKQSPWASPQRVSHVLLNLLHNAVEAIPPGDPPGHEVRIRSYDEGERVVLEVSDTGAGIPADTLPRVFDPFFTTRAVGKGRGLGLSVAQSMARGMGGELSVTSTEGKGSCFRLCLPVHPPSVRVPEPGALSSHPKVRILLMDDDVATYEAVERALATRAAVALARDPGEAFALLEKGETFDLLLWDVTKAKLRGAAAFLELAERMPATARRVFFLAGGVAPSSVQQLLARYPSRRLERPLSPVHLGEIVEQLTRGTLVLV